MEIERNSVCPLWDDNTYNCTVRNVEPRVACNPYKMKRMGIGKHSPEESTDYHRCIFYILNNKGKL